MKKSAFVSLCAALLSLAAQAGPVTVGNGIVSLSFDGETGALVSFRDEAAGRELLTAPSRDLWTVVRRDGSFWHPELPLQVSFSPSGDRALDVCWTDGPTRFTAHIRLEEDSPLTYWSLSVEGLRPLQAQEIHFPVISTFRPGGEGEQLAASTWLGSLIRAPRAGVSAEKPRIAHAWRSPGNLSMQLVALYDDAGHGLYFGSNDTLSFTKHTEIGFQAQATDWRMGHALPWDDADTYRMPYEAVVGPFQGDWLQAAEMYRTWAVRQRWCRESRFHQGLTPRWVRETDLWIWNRGRSENVLTEAADMKRRTGRRVSVFWHWWHGCSYDEGFPEYIPPREGRDSFVKAVRKAVRKGIHCLVYMNSFQWGNSTRSWKEEGAERYAARTGNGGLYSYAANVFTGRQITAMCMATDFWRNRYATLADTVVNSYGVAGVYMDQACTNMPCFATDHPHRPGGGNYWATSFRKLTDDIRSRCPATLAGEGSGEDWIPALDLFLTLENSRERYLGTGAETIPLYQAVYHDYAVTYGSYSSLVYPPYDEMWPDEYRPENREKSLPADFDMQFRMEQSRAFVWGMQPTLANYHPFLWDEKPLEMAYLRRIVNVRRRALKYLLHGVYTRVPASVVSPTQEIDLSRISIYAGRTGSTVSSERRTVPTLYSGGWKAADGSLAFSLANIADEGCTVPLRFDLSDYGLQGHCRIRVVTEKGCRKIGVCKDGKVSVEVPLGPRDAQVIVFEPR